MVCLNEESENLSPEARERWKTEEQFINNRLTWLSFTQSLLFAAYGISLTTENPLPEISYFKRLIPFIGLIILTGVLGAIMAMYKLNTTALLSSEIRVFRCKTHVAVAILSD